MDAFEDWRVVRLDNNGRIIWYGAALNKKVAIERSIQFTLEGVITDRFIYIAKPFKDIGEMYRD